MINKRGRKRGKKRKLLIPLVILFLLVGGLVYGLSEFAFTNGDDLVSNPPEGALTEEELKNRVSVLLVGADQRPGEEKFNTDSIILASIDPKNARVSLLSIPRDTRVSIPGYSELKINGVVPRTDMETLVDVVSDLTGVPIAGYIQTNFDGFKNIIDTLGGITVDVEKDMYFETGDKKDGVIDLKKGVQKLDGSKALQYARFRNDALADISRTARQQVVLKAVADEMLKLSTLPKLPWLIPQLNDAVNTNLALGDMFKIARSAVKFKDLDIVTQTLPGRFYDKYGVSYWEVDPDRVKEVVQNLFRGITTDEVIGDSIIDLLDPIEPEETPQVPGNFEDPNGSASSEYDEERPDDLDEEELGGETPGGTDISDGETGEGSSGDEKPGNDNGDELGEDTPGDSEPGGENSEDEQGEENSDPNDPGDGNPGTGELDGGTDGGSDQGENP
ncbi:MAG: transcriptional regulator [Desulfitobacterium sp.]|nr:transcriptional regulator [Desulfitobacterium sp.]